MAAQTEAARAEIILNGSKANATLKELENAAKALNAEWRKMAQGSKEFSDTATQLQGVNQKIYDIRKQTQALKEDMKKTEGGLDGMMNSLKTAAIGAGAALAAAFSLHAIKDYFQEAVKGAVELKSVEKNLLDVLGGNKAVQRELVNLAKEREGSTKSTRMEIEAAEKFLAIQERSPEQIKKTILAAEDLSAMTGKTLQQSVEDLDATMEGRLGKTLPKLSKDLKDLTKEQLYHGAAIDMIAEKYRGLAEEEMKTQEGELILLGKSWTILQRTIGEALLGTGGFFEGMISSTREAIGTMTKFFEIPMDQKIRKEQESLNGLVFQIQATNTNQKERNRLIAELRAKYPEFLENVKTEDVTNQFLAKHLEEVNIQYMEKIRLAQSEEALTEIAEKEIKASKKLSDAEAERNNILAKSMSLLYASKPAYAALVEQATSLEEKIKLVKKYWGDGTNASTGTGADFLIAAQKAKEAADKMRVYSVEFKAEQLKIAESAVSSSLALVNNLDSVSNQLLVIAMGTTDKTTRMIIQAEMEDRERKGKLAKAEIKQYTEDLDFKKMSADQLNEYISRGREADATNSDRTNMRKAQTELDHRLKLDDKLKESYKNLMDELKLIEGKNYADKFTQTQQEIRNVTEKYDTLIVKARKFAAENEKALSPAQKKEVAEQITNLQGAKDAQIHQVMLQAEQVFADNVKKIDENLRVARLDVISRQVYEVNKKYDDQRKEIMGAIFFAYAEEIKAAEGQNDKLILAEKHKKEAIAAVDGDMKYLAKAQKADVAKVREEGNQKFDETLNNLKLKGEKDLAIGKEKIQLSVNAKYKKILEDSVGDQAKTDAIKLQMTEEVSASQLKLTQENAQKIMQESIAIAQTAVNALGSVFQMQDQAAADGLKKDDDIANKKKAALDAQLKSKRISQKTHDLEVAKVDAEMAKKRQKLDHDAAVHAKEMALFNALISVAVAIAGALATPPGPGGIVMSIIAAALGAIQIGFILSQKVPAAATGRFNVIGEQDGRAYNDVPYQESFTGIPGRPMLVNETGNEIVIDPKTTRNLMVNYPGVINAINFARVPQRSGGSYLPENATPTPQQAANAASSESFTNALLEFNAHARNGIRTFVVYDDVRDSAATINDIETSVKSS
ncbi:MAG: hypothetical protein NT040_11255 [Bacteroidetes bacterium]|nr:hypothetical protein [Bacteroidota bacterium]